jgi:hypothetical protein
VAETKYLPVLCDAMMKNAVKIMFYSGFLHHGIAVVWSLGEVIRVFFPGRCLVRAWGVVRSAANLKVIAQAV